MERFEDSRESTSLVQSAPAPLRAPGSSQVFDVTPEKAPHLRDYWNIILKRRWVVLSTLAIVFFTVVVGTLKQEPVYRATVLLEITPEQPNVLNFQEILQVQSQNADVYRETRFRVLKSRSLAERVVRRLELYRRPEFYKASSLFGLLELDPEPVPTPNGTEDIQELRQAYRNSVANFIDRISVSPLRRSNLAEVSFDLTNPSLATTVANQLTSEFINHNLQMKWEETQKASEWLSGQLVGLKAKLEKSEDGLQAYAQRNSILFVSERRELANTRLEQLQQELTTAQSERFQKESVHRLVREGRVDDIPDILSNTLIQTLTSRLAELEQEYAEKTSILKPDYPAVVQIQKQMDAVKATLERQKEILGQNVAGAYQAALNREKLLEEALAHQRDVVNQIASKSIQYNILKREVDTSRQLYEGLLQRMKEAQVSAGLTATNIHIVDTAEVPGRPVKPRVLLNLALGLILGASLGAGLAFFQEYLDNTIKTPDEVEQYLNLPALGIIPRFHSNGLRNVDGQALAIPEEFSHATLILSHADNSHIVEAYRSLRTSILLSANPVPKTLLVTSSLPKEGKTTTSVNLAAILAGLGEKKIVLVDCDFRRPSVHKAVGVSKVPGFVQALTGQMDIGDVIREVPNVPNLYVIPCGLIPPNPAELLSSAAASELVQRLRSEFEFVVIDSPPLLSVADSRILATQVDGVVLVVKGHSTPREVVRDARTLLAGSNGRILGVTINDLDLAREGYGRYGTYRYGYRYGQGYGYAQDDQDQAEDQQAAS